MRKTETPTMEQMDAALHLTLDRAEAAEAQVKRLQAKLDGLMEAFEKNGSLGILQLIAHDKNLPVEIRMRAAGLAVPYERPKYGTVDGLVIQGDFKERVRNARLKADAKLRAQWAAEDAAKVIEGTVLGSDREGGPALGPEADPAA
jgi:hypothetical protein